ncbi:MAG: hypothetical protein CL840_09480 [Crocinitomicaceae bacterium]|nr:hypothetical protein [Crocinitomicaceae bacterium]|tara:strand:- start:8851 stop:11874 length:3024 start_codon:yes stop_codon:yes gene_type:complete
MKKVSLLVGTVLFAGITAFGQSQIGSGVNNIQEEYVYEEAPVDVTTGKKKKADKGALAAPGRFFVNEDFGSGKIPSGWTVKTNSSHSGGWAWTDKMSQGQYARGTAAIRSTTGSNGFMILDSDLMNPGSSAGFSTVDAYVEIPLPSLVGVTSVSMTFEHYWRPFSNVEMYILASKNGTTWDTVRVDHGVPVNTTSSDHFKGPSEPEGYAYKERISLGCVIGGASSPKIRIHWAGASHYFWQVDDIKIQEGEYNDIDMVESFGAMYTDTTYLNYSDIYSRIPMKQANKMEFGFAGKYQNSGSAAQQNVRLNLELDGPGGFKETAKSTPKNLPVCSVDSNDITVTKSSFKFSGGMGSYDAKLFCTSDSILVRTANDTLHHIVDVTDSVYARDRANPGSASVVYYNPSVVQQYEVGTYYETVEIDTITSVSFYMDEANARRTNKAGSVQCHVYRTNGLGSNGVQTIVNTPLFSSKKIPIKDLYSQIGTTGSWISLKVERNATGVMDTVNSGGLIATFVADQFFGTDTIFVSLEGRDGMQSHNFLRQEQGGSWGNWGYSTNKQFVRLNVTPNVCPALNGSATATATTSCGASDGTATAVDPTNGSGSYRYAWSAAGTPTSKTISNLPSGIYQVTITDGNGCAQVSAATVSDAGAPVLKNESTKNVVCAGKGEGEVQFNLTAGAAGPGYTITWFDSKGDTVKVGAGATSADSLLAGVESGKYTVQIADKGVPPCLQTKTYDITGPTAAVSVSSNTVTHVTCNGDKDGSVVITPVGGTGTLTISWPDGSSGSTVTGLAGGPVTVTVTDANNCTFTETYTVNEPNVLKVNAEGTGSTDTKVTKDTDKGTVTISPYVEGGTSSAGYLHTWTNSSGDPCTVESNNDFIIGGNPGNSAYDNQRTQGVYNLKVQDDNACVANKAYTIDNTVGFETFGENYELRVFPNPNNGTFKVSMVNTDAGDYTFEVKNMLGQVVYDEVVSINGNYLNTVQLSDNGVYFLSISNGEKTESYKIIVE